MARRVPIQQYSFSSGILAPSLEARKDMKRYYDGALEAKNVTVQTHGGMRRRGGLRFGSEFADAATGAEITKFEFNKDQVYLVAFTDSKISIFKNWVFQASVVAPWGVLDLPTLDTTQSLDTMLVAHGGIQTQRLERQGSDTAWALSAAPFTNVPTYRFAPVPLGTGTPSATSGTATFTSSVAIFAAADVGKWVIGNQGKGKITVFTSATAVTIAIKQNFKDLTAIAAGAWSLEEDAWSAARGWPKSIDFYQGRTVVGGSKTLLDKVWASTSGDFFDFKSTWEALADESLDATLTHGSQVNQVQRVSAMQSLFALTTGGLFAANDVPLTPANFLPVKNSAVPSATLAPVELEETVAFIAADESGAATGLHRLVVDPDSNAVRYIADNLSLLAPHVLTSPQSIAVRKGNTVAGASHAFVTNADGTAAVFHSRKRQNMMAWTWWESRGNSGTDALQRVAVVGGIPVFLVKRTLGSGVKYFIEYLDENAFFDSSIQQTSGTAKSTWSGFGHLEGETVNVWADGVLRDDAQVTGGQIVVTGGGDPLLVSAVEAGLPLDWALETMPPEAQLGDGTLTGHNYRIFKAAIRVANAYDLTVNGRAVAFRHMNTLHLDTPPTAYSGLKDVKFLGRSHGEEKAQTVRMSGQLPITIEAVTAFVAG